MCEISTVDWNPEQTKLWKHHILKHNPNARIYLEQDINPLRDTIPGLAKLRCYGRIYETGRILIMDTDIITTGSLVPLFESMDRLGCSIGVTKSNSPGGLRSMTGSILLGREKDGRYISKKHNFNFRTGLDRLNDEFGVENVIYYCSGMIAFNEYKPHDLYEGVKEIVDFSLEHDLFDGDVFLEEIALSYFIAMEVKRGMKVFEVPFSIHGIIANKLLFGGVKEPLMIHYHNFPKLKKFGLWKYMEDME